MSSNVLIAQGLESHVAWPKLPGRNTAFPRLNLSEVRYDHRRSNITSSLCGAMESELIVIFVHWWPQTNQEATSSTKAEPSDWTPQSQFSTLTDRSSVAVIVTQINNASSIKVHTRHLDWFNSTWLKPRQTLTIQTCVGKGASSVDITAWSPSRPG